MKHTLLVTGIVLGAVLGWLALDPPAPRGASANSFGPPAAKTLAPGEGICTECHTGHTVNPDTLGSVTILGAPASYTPGQTYALVLGVQRPGQMRWGFEITALKASNNTAAGTFVSTTALTRIVSLSGRSYVEQTTLNGDGTFAGQTEGAWTFNWTAPAAGAGTVTFYAAGNAANGDFSSTGDFIYATNTSSTEGSATDVSATTWGKIKMLYR